MRSCFMASSRLLLKDILRILISFTDFPLHLGVIYCQDCLCGEYHSLEGNQIKILFDFIWFLYDM